MSTSQRCPCGTGEVLADCCGPVLSGQRPAVTALELMRSRFTAFTVGDAAHLRVSWHPNTRPRRMELDDDVRWLRLELVEVVAGEQWDEHGTVSFRAHHRSAQGRGVLAERSMFVREHGRWLYVTGTPTG